MLLFVFTLPLWRNINTIMLWFFVAGWLIVSTYKVKIQILKQNKISFILFLLLYLLYTFSGLIEGDFKPMERKLALVIIPLLVFSTEKKHLNIKSIFTAFGLGIVIAMLISWGAIIESIFDRPKDYYIEQAQYFFEWRYTGDNLTSVLGLHPSYLALMLVFFLSILLYERTFISIKKRKIIFLIIIILFLFFLIETASRIAIIALILIFILKNIKKVTIKKSFFSLIIFAILFFISLKFDYLLKKMINLMTGDERIHRWIEIFKVLITKNYWFIGFGETGSEKLYLEAYKNGGFILAYKNKYNAHNQFLEVLIKMGLPGLIVYTYLFYHFIKKTKLIKIAFYFFLIFFLFSLGESFFERSKGLFLFTFFYSILIKHYQKNE